MYLVIPSKKKLKVMGLTYNALPPGRRGRELKKNMALEARFGGGGLKGQGGGILRGAGGAKLSEEARFSRVTMMVFCKRVFSVATLVLIIHITMSMLISLI